MRDPDSWKGQTENAAWETVRSLREELRRERVFADRLTPFQENWRKIIAELEELAERCGLESERYLDIVVGIKQQMIDLHRETKDLRRRCEELQIGAVHQQVASEVVTVISERRPESAAALAHDSSREIAWFARCMQRARAKSGKAARRRSQDHLIQRLESKLEELEQAPRTELADIAVETALLALDLALGSQTPAYRIALSDDPEDADD